MRPPAAILTALALGACTVGTAASPDPLPELAAPAAPLPADLALPEVPASTPPAPADVPAPEASASGSPPAASAAPAPSPAGDAPPTPVAASPSVGAPRFATVLDLADPFGDTGPPAGPANTDLVRLVVQDDGVRARITVVVAGTVPSRLGDGEVIGLGVDLYRSTDADESEYQLFADGGSDGWRAFLHTPAGFVDYPGSFHVGDDRIVFELGWEHLGGLRRGQASAFLDWSRPGLVLNDATTDRAPDAGRAAYDG